MSDRSSASRERSNGVNPPTLPQAGSPSFKPVSRPTSISTLQPSSVSPREHVPPVPQVITQGAKSLALPAEMSTLASDGIDHCGCSTVSCTIECVCAHIVLMLSYTVSRSTSMSSLTTGTGSVGFSLCIYSN